MPGSAIGLIETKGLLGAIAALDAALKAAQVRLVSFSAVRGGRINFVLGGEVAAVSSAVDAGCEVVQSMGCLRGRHVIPRPAEDVERLLGESGLKLGGPARLRVAGTSRKIDSGCTPSPGHCDALEGIHTTELRRMLRGFNDGSYGGREISRMRKEELVEIIRRKRTEAGHGEKGDAGR
jgi:ethanolamine utilization protein EutM